MYDMCFVCPSTKTLQFFFLSLKLLVLLPVVLCVFFTFYHHIHSANEESSLRLMLCYRYLLLFFPIRFLLIFSEPKQRHWLISVRDIFTSCHTHKRVRPLLFRSCFDHFVFHFSFCSFPCTLHPPIPIIQQFDLLVALRYWSFCSALLSSLRFSNHYSCVPIVTFFRGFNFINAPKMRPDAYRITVDEISD